MVCHDRHVPESAPQELPLRRFKPKYPAFGALYLKETATTTQGLGTPRTCYYTILYSIILYYTILYYTILYYIILHYTILYYTILYTYNAHSKHGRPSCKSQFRLLSTCHVILGSLVRGLWRFLRRFLQTCICRWMHPWLKNVV